MQKRLGFSRAIGALLATALTAVGPAPAGAIPTLPVQAPARADQPAMWVLSDADTTIYLFGTFHALDQKTDWFGRNIRAAFDSSDELILETLVPSDPIELHRVLAARELSGGAMVVGAPVLAAPVPGNFAASAGQAVAAGRSAGLSVDSGADAVLRRTADAEGKAVDGLESFEAQLAMFTALPAPSAAAPSAASPDVRRAMTDLRSAWRRGDCATFAAILGRMQSQSPATYERLFVERNDHWAQWIAQRMATPGTIFVAVGAGHLIGPDSVQQKLALRGYRSTRIY